MNQLQIEKIWDPVTRLWHWVLAFAVSLNWTFGTFMSFDTVIWHFYIGYLILSLIVLRILRGMFGPAPVRLRTLLPSPPSLLRYLRTLLRREPSGTPGHNPLGALSVVAMLLVITAQGCSGLFIESEDFFEYGPLNSYVSAEAVKYMIGWHHLLAKAILSLVILHTSAIIFYLLWKGENLIKPMITGWKQVRK